jgi:uncharacterized integral membrane protein
MKKNFLQDVVPPTQKRSIRDIPLPQSKNKDTQAVEPPRQEASVKKVSKTKPEVAPPSTPPTPPTSNDNYSFDDYSDFDKPRKKRKWLWISLIILLIVIFAVVNRTKAEIIIFPKQETVQVNDSYSIVNKTLEDVDGALGYKILSLEKEVSIIVEASGEEEVTQKASGRIKIKNEFSSEAQKLVERTRFETKKGLVYRIAESVSVPGYTEVDGEIVAGEIEVEVFADEAGEKYNIEKTDFTVPGFKGLEQFDSIWAEGVTEMSGGFVGKRKVVSEEDKALALEELKKQAAEGIISDIEQNSDEFVIVYNSEDLEYTQIKENEAGSGVELKLKASVNGFVFDSNELARFIADKNIPNAPEGEMIVMNVSDLNSDTVAVISVAIEDEDGEVTGENLKLMIDSKVDLQWVINEDTIASAMEGKKRNELQTVVSDYKGIIRAEASLAPFWRSKFPKAGKIDVIIEE